MKHGKKSSTCNVFSIALISERKGAVELGDFRPICLVDTLHKILIPSKAFRIKVEIVNSETSLHQNALIKHRTISNAALIANEVLDWRSKSGEPGNM